MSLQKYKRNSLIAKHMEAEKATVVKPKEEKKEKKEVINKKKKK